MFLTLLVVTFVVALCASAVVAWLFRKPVSRILTRLVPDELADAWRRYLGFAIYIVGISGGVRVWDLEKYITARTPAGEAILLTRDRWVLEVYRTLISTLQSAAWLLFLFFVFALVAYVIVRGLEMRRAAAGN